MGAWGPAIFSDDTACDIRDEYKRLLSEGNDGAEAANILIKGWSGELDDPETATVFWLALAATQWKVGRLEDRVKNKALEIIESGEDLLRWQEESDAKSAKKREQALLKLKDQLHQPQPAPKKLPKRFVLETTLEAGDAISYQLLSGNYIVLKVVEIIEKPNGDRYPRFEMCDWVGDSIPSPEEISQLPPLMLTVDLCGKKRTDIVRAAIFPAGKRDNPDKRITLIAKGVHIDPDFKGGHHLYMVWKQLDRSLQSFYKLP